MSWNNGYVTEIEYTYGYYIELCPQLISLGLLWRKQKGYKKKGMRYLELGFGQGVSLNIHAAANDGEFWGTDFNPSQAVHARAMAEASGANLVIMDDSFEELAARQDLPKFDVITIHGIWSWISEENRRHIIDIIRKHLALGGAVYLSYNCSQGWAATIPARQLMMLYMSNATSKADGIVNQVNATFGFLDKLAASGSNYFRNNPIVGTKLEYFRDKTRSYVAHELFNADWSPMMFCDVAKYIEDAKLSYVGSGKILDFFDAIQLNPQSQALLASISDGVLRETVRDFSMDRPFRSDLYTRGVNTMPLADRDRILRSTRFMLTIVAKDLPMTVTGSLGELNLKKEIYGPIMEFLAKDGYAPKSIADLEQALDKKAFSFVSIAESLMVLVGANRASVVHDPDTIKKVGNRTAALNRFFIERAVYADECSVLASPITGSAIESNRIYMLFLRSINAGGRNYAKWVEETWAILSMQNQRLIKEGKAIEKIEDNIAELNRQAEAFEKEVLPLYKALGLV